MADTEPTVTEESRDLPDEIFDIETATEPVIRHRAALLNDDDTFHGTFENIVEPRPVRLAVKFNFQHIERWASLAKLTFYLRQGNGLRKDDGQPRDPTELREARASMGKGCIRSINVSPVHPDAQYPSLALEPRLRKALLDGRVHLLTIEYDPGRLCHHGFHVPDVGGTPYPQLSDALRLLLAPGPRTLRVLLETKAHIVEAVQHFRERLDVNVPDYAKFYPKHPRDHYVQMGDYPPASDRPSPHVPAVTTFDTESRFQTVVGFGAIGEHEHEQVQTQAIADATFSLRLMAIPLSRDRHYLGFLEPLDRTDARLEIHDRLTVNFDPRQRVQEENWSATVVEAMPWTPLGHTTIFLSRLFDPVLNRFDPMKLKVAPEDASTIEAASVAVMATHAYDVAITQTVSDKTFQRRLFALHTLHHGSQCRWWRGYVLGRDVRPTFHWDIYETCGPAARELFRPTNFNALQTEAVDYMRSLPNGIGLIAGPAGSGKTMFVTAMLSPFLHTVHRDTPSPDAPSRKDDPSSSEQSTIAKNDPSSSEPSTIAKNDPSSSEPSTMIKDDPSSSEPSAMIEDDPSSSEPSTIAKNDPSSSEPSTIAKNDPSSSEPSTIIKHDPSSSVPSHPATDDPTQPTSSLGPPAPGTPRAVSAPVISPLSSGVLVCAPSNATVDEFAASLVRMARSNPTSKDAIIIRLHPAPVEKSYVQHMSQPGGSDQAEVIDPSSHKETLALAQLFIAKTVYDAHQALEASPHGVRDRRFVKVELSLAHWMLTIAGIVKTDHPKAAPHHHKQFVEYFERVQGGEILDQADNVHFGSARHRLACHTLTLANAVVCTFATAGEATLYTSFRPAAIVCEEAPRATEADTAILLAHYPKVPLILLGDEAQLRPVIKSGRENGFARQLAMSLFERLRILGQSSVLFRVQHRSNEQIGSMVSTLFYGGELTNATATDRPFTRALQTHNDRTFGVRSSVVLLKCRGLQETDGTQSRYNVTNASEVMHIATDLIRQGVLPADHVLIITPYQAQLKLYDRCLRNLAMAPDTAHLAAIRTSTVDNIQGSDGHLVILDLVSTRNLGFMSHRNRLNVALSRARDGLIIIGDVDGLAQAHKNERKHFMGVCNYIARRRWQAKAPESATPYPFTFPLAPPEETAAPSRATPGTKAAEPTWGGEDTSAWSDPHGGQPSAGGDGGGNAASSNW